MKSFIVLTVLSLIGIKSFALELGPVVTKSEAAAEGIGCYGTDPSSDLCETYKWKAEIYCENQGTRLPTILELATALVPQRIVPATEITYPLPIKPELTAVDAFNYEDFSSNLKPIISKRLDQFYFRGYMGPVDDGPNAIEGRAYWSISSSPSTEHTAWTLYVGLKTQTGEEVAMADAWVVRPGGVTFPFRCVAK